MIYIANFKEACEKTLEFEGGYSDNPFDEGGQTYRGISKEFHPDWKGWSFYPDFEKMDEYVYQFYKDEFWDLISGDLINDQDIANNIYDFAVNCGVVRAIVYAQRVVGVVDDGVMGTETLNALNGYNGFIESYKEARLNFVRAIVRNDETQSIFLEGWVNRINNV